MPKPKPLVALKARKTPILWWAVGFISALMTLFGMTMWMAGSVYSELPAPAALEQGYQPADVIVCLTGGRGRIRKALELFERGYGKMLYISGTDRQVQIKEILKELQWIGPVNESRIVLENVSTNTLENAKQVDLFVRNHGFKKVLLVTSIYHVRRAHYIFRKVLPREVQIDVSWYGQDPFEKDDWWKSTRGIWVTTGEFFKFFYAYLRLMS